MTVMLKNNNNFDLYIANLRSNYKYIAKIDKKDEEYGAQSCIFNQMVCEVEYKNICLYFAGSAGFL